jgi:hypothetical protein
MQLDTSVGRRKYGHFQKAPSWYRIARNLPSGAKAQLICGLLRHDDPEGSPVVPFQNINDHLRGGHHWPAFLTDGAST